MLRFSHDDRMARFWIRVQGVHIFHDARTYRVQVDIANQFEKVGISFAEKRLIAVLEQVPVTIMTSVELLGITGEQSAHDGGDGGCSCSQKKVDMVGNKSPGMTGSRGLGEDGPETAEKVFVVPGTFEDRVLFYASNNDVMKGAGGIDACFTGHREVLHDNDQMSIFHQRPLFRPILDSGILRGDGFQNLISS